MKILRALAGLAVFTALALPAVASAHSIEYVAAQTTLRVDGSRILLHSEVPSLITADIESSADEKSYYQDYFERELTIWTADRACKFKLSSLKIGPEAQSTFDGVYTCPAPVRQVTDLKIHSQLYDIFFTNFDHIATVRIGEASWRLTFSPSARDYPGTVQAVAEARSGQSASPWQTFWTVAGQFTGMGAMHIFTG